MRKPLALPQNFKMPLRGGLLLSALLYLFVVALSCASAPEYPAAVPPTTKVLPVNINQSFQVVRDVLLSDPRLELHTLDTGGRIVAREKTSGFIFWQHRTILDFLLEPAGENQTKIVMLLEAEQYESGGLTRAAGWYPSSDIDTFLGEDVLGLIEKAATEAVKK